MNLYLDMDGVLMDFEGAIAAHGVPSFLDGKKYIHLPHDQWPAEMVAADAAYVTAMTKENFWNTLQPMQDAFELWDFCCLHKPRILTATPPRIASQDVLARIGQQKRGSILQHFDSSFPQEHIHVCLRHEKAAFARPSAILVDDTSGNCDEWVKAGGVAILHVSAAQTIKELKDLGYA